MLNWIKSKILTAGSSTYPIAAYRLLKHGSIIQKGWIESFRKGVPVDRLGAPLPWYTYAAISFLESRMPRDIDILEFGGGNSTMWWMSRARTVRTAETDEKWAAMIRSKAGPNVSVVVSKLQSAEDWSALPLDGASYDVVVIDGAERNACAYHVPDYITPAGIVIFDNSDREEYREGYDFLQAQGYRRVDFWGMGPINLYESGTSIFYRPGNILDL